MQDESDLAFEAAWRCASCSHGTYVSVTYVLYVHTYPPVTLLVVLNPLSTHLGTCMPTYIHTKRVVKHPNRGTGKPGCSVFVNFKTTSPEVKLRCGGCGCELPEGGVNTAAHVPLPHVFYACMRACVKKCGC